MRASPTVNLIASNIRPLTRAGMAALSPVHLLIILHVGLTVFLSYRLNIWLDEAFTLYTTGNGFWHAFYESLRFELQPPLYFVLLSLWRKLNDSIFFARIPSVFFIALSIKISVDLAKRFLKEINSELVVACVATNPFLIWAAVEMRLYALVILLSTLLLRFFYDGFLEDQPRKWAHVWYVVFSIAALYTQYYLGFLLLANASALVALRRWRSLTNYLVAMGVVAIFLAPMTFQILAQASAHIPQGESPSSLQAIQVIYWGVQEYLMPVGWEPLYFVRRWLLRIGGAVLLLLLVFKYRRAIKAETIAICVPTALLGFCFLTLLRLTAEEIVDGRHTAALVLPLTLSMFSLLSTIGRKVIVVWTLAVCLSNTSAVYATYQPMAKSGDWFRVASYLATCETAGQPILVFRHHSVLPLAHYYNGSNKLVPIPTPYMFDNPGAYYPDLVMTSEPQLATAISQVSSSPEVWLVTDWQSGFSGDGIDDAVLKRVVERTYTIEKSRTFYNSKVFQLRRNSSSN